MSQRFRTRDLDAFDHDESDLVGPLLGDVERRVQIASRYERFPRADFDMVRDGDGVEAVFPCLVDAHGRPYAAVREDRVRVKVAFEHMETVDIRNPDVVAPGRLFPSRAVRRLRRCGFDRSETASPKARPESEFFSSLVYLGLVYSIKLEKLSEEVSLETAFCR